LLYHRDTVTYTFVTSSNSNHRGDQEQTQQLSHQRQSQKEPNQNHDHPRTVQHVLQSIKILYRCDPHTIGAFRIRCQSQGHSVRLARDLATRVGGEDRQQQIQIHVGFCISNRQNTIFGRRRVPLFVFRSK